MIKLSKRLQAIADMVTEGYVVADIGTDHGYIPIYLIQTGKIPRALAADVNPGPLERAREHIYRAHLEDKIQIRLSDGFAALKKGEADCAVVAGMGGALMLRILMEGGQAAAGLKELILQPQSEIPALRAKIRELGFEIQDEDMVKEDGKYYPMMRVVPAKTTYGHGDVQESGKTADQIRLEDLFGPVLLKKRHPVLAEWIDREKKICEKILAKLPAAEEARRKEVEEKVGLLDQAVFQMNKDRKQ